MSDTDPLAPTLGAHDPQQPAQAGRRRTLRGAMATIVLVVGLLAAMAAPKAVFVGLLLAPTVLGVAAMAVSFGRRRSGGTGKLCLPGTDRCAQA